MINIITKAYIRHYRDNGATVAGVEWLDTRGERGITEGTVGRCRKCGRGHKHDIGPHMQALFARAERDGLTIERETW